MTSLPLTFRQPAAYQLLADIRSGFRPLWVSTVAMMLLCLVCAALTQVDPRLFNGISVWEKPAKFFLAVGVQFATVSWAMTKLPQVDRSASIAARILVTCGWAENIYITACAALGQASHFNNSTPLTAIAFALMGVGAVAMTASSFYIGLQVWRKGGHGLWADAAALGLMAGAVLGTLAGAYIGNQSSHWVGGIQSDAGALAFFNWSVTGGDLRVAHFVGLHAAQFIPIAALSGSRTVVYGVTAVCILATGAVFLMAIAGIPLFKL